MLSLDINRVGKAVFDELKDVIVTWFSVLSGGPKALESVDLGANSTLLFALRFLFYIGLVDLVVEIPFEAANGVRYTDELYVGLSVAGIYFTYLSLALILHGALRLFGGRGRLQESVAAFCLLTAYLPVAAALRMPTVPVLAGAVEAGTNFPDVMARGTAALSHLSRWNLTVFLLSTFLSTGVTVVFLVAVFRCFRRLHALSRFRALAGYTTGLLLASAFWIVFLLPFAGAVDRTFTKR